MNVAQRLAECANAFKTNLDLEVWKSGRVGILSSPPKQKQSGREGDGDQPPKPVNAARSRLLGAELLLHKIVVIKILVGEVEGTEARLFGPTGLLIRTAGGTGPRLGGNFGTAVRANFRSFGHLRFSIYDLRVAPKFSAAAADGLNT
jgi:hypothetical protein